MFLFAGSAAPVAPTVSIGAGVTRLGNTNQASTTLAGMFTPATGDALVRLLYRAAAAAVAPLTVRIGTATVTMRASDDAGVAGGAGVWIGTVRGLPTGAALDVVVSSATANLGKIICRVNQVASWGGLVGDAFAVATRYPGQVYGTSGALTAQGSFRPMAAVGGAINANGSPLSAEGWSLTDAMTVGSTAGASSAAGFFNTTGGAPGAGTGFHLASATPWTDWAAAGLELL